MLVYGDDRRVESPRALLASLRRRLKLPPKGRPEALLPWATDLLISTGELVQGILDAAFDRHGVDNIGEDSSISTQAAVSAARIFLSARAHACPRPTLRAARVLDRDLVRLTYVGLPDEIVVGTPEGYAYYAVYPELYALAAEELRNLPGPWVIIGLRSIGTSLASVVAGVLDCGDVYFVRPVGHPFRRVAAFGPSLERALVGRSAGAHYAVVDEGPGMSGSTFGAVADWLELRGIRLDHIHFLPSHGGDLGGEANPIHQQRWRCAHRPHTRFESYFDEARILREIFGRPEAELRDISGGRWRKELYPEKEGWPPAYPRLERRKFICGSPGQWQIAKFAGLGSYGQALFDRALRLYQRRFIPEPLALRHGFLVSTWYDGGVPLDRAVIDRGRWLAWAAEYLAFLQAEFCRPLGGGTPFSILLHMAIVNIGEGVSREAANLFEQRWARSLPAIAETCVPIANDGRLQPWEWLVLPDGSIRKTDALEHHANHGLVGCQDLAWDLAGLRIEHALSASEYEKVLGEISRTTAYRHHPDKESFFVQCYLAYQLGYYAVAGESVRGIDPAEDQRLLSRRDFYAARLTEQLGEVR